MYSTSLTEDTPQIAGVMEEAIFINTPTAPRGPSNDKARVVNAPPNSARQSFTREITLRTNNNLPDKICSTKYRACRVGLRYCAFTAITVCIFNLVLTIVAVEKHSIVDGLGTLQIGDCTSTKRLSQWLHLLINILSTILLGASNYSMQILSAPTRQMIDKAHQSGIWLDVGVPSIRNLRWVSRSRIMTWCLLAISSVPLHLMYNSAVFSVLTYQQYSAFVVADTFSTGAPFSLPSNATNSNYNFTYFDYSSQTRHEAEGLLGTLQSQVLNMQHLDNQSCMEIFNTFLQPTYTDVLLVSSQGETPNSVLAVAGTFGAGASYQYLTEKVDTTTPQVPLFGRYPISYCLAKPNKRCRLQFSLAIMFVIIICNAIKAICMTSLIWTQSKPLLTIGDAIASFLENPDPTTEAYPVADKYHSIKHTVSHEAAQAAYRARYHLWFSSASRRRWFITTILCLAILVPFICGLVSERVRNNGPSLMSLSFGAMSGSTLIKTNSSLRSSLIAMVILANSPQLVLSILYFSYNSLFTCMLLGKEWSGYAYKRQGLRVTAPRGDQRSTYRLQLPYRYGIPLLVLLGLLHWLVSQSLFLVKASALTENGDLNPKYDISTCGYSPSAILVTIIVGAVILALAFMNGFRSYRPGMPLVGSCSTAISAACHPPMGDSNPSAKKVKWGLCDKAGSAHFEHYSFTSFEVNEAVESTKSLARPNATLRGTEALEPKAVGSLNSIRGSRFETSSVGSDACQCTICQVKLDLMFAEKPVLLNKMTHAEKRRRLKAMTETKTEKKAETKTLKSALIAR